MYQILRHTGVPEYIWHNLHACVCSCICTFTSV